MLETLLLALDDEALTRLSYSGATIVAIIAVFASITVWRSKEGAARRDREGTLREIAAYVAEGSITPEDGERLIRAVGELDETTFRRSLDDAKVARR